VGSQQGDFAGRLQMILHNIKPAQLAELETIFGRKTSSGFEIPEWLISLRETATQHQKDFEATAQAFRARPSNGQ
jgi:hypothetical protein